MRLFENRRRSLTTVAIAVAIISALRSGCDWAPRRITTLSLPVGLGTSALALSPLGGTSSPVAAWRFSFSDDVSRAETGSSLYEAEMSRTLSFSNSTSGCAAPVGRVRFRIRERRLKLVPLVLAVLASEFERDVPGNMAVEESGMRVPAGAWVSRAQLASTCSCKLATKQTAFLWKIENLFMVSPHVKRRT